MMKVVKECMDRREEHEQHNARTRHADSGRGSSMQTTGLVITLFMAMLVGWFGETKDLVIIIQVIVMYVGLGITYIVVKIDERFRR